MAEKVKGKIPPYGGRWTYDPEKDELTPVEPQSEPENSEEKEVENDADK